MKGADRVYENKAIASVITPVHNTDLSIFREAYQSLLDQSCGFERIEWLVAVNTADDVYAREIRSVAGEQDNIVYLRAYGAFTPSVPRNICIENARGDYVFFLDSDDRMAPDCIEKTVSAMEENDADLAVFNCVILSEPGTLEIATEGSLNAPDEELVVYEKGDPRILSLMADWGGMLWSRAYRRSLLNRCAARFDEDQRLGEDLLFNLAVTPYAERVLAMPHLAGYIHINRRGSVAQSEMSKGRDEEILRYLPALQEHGAMEALWFHVSWFIRKAMNDKDGGRFSQPERLASVLKGLRVMAPRFALTRERIAGMLSMGAAFFSLPTAPRLRGWHQRLEIVPKEQNLRCAVKKAARENIELRTIGTEGKLSPFLGVEDPGALPQVVMLDLKSMDPGQQKRHMDSYRRMEVFRGFWDNAEVKCRVTVFVLSAHESELSVTWDDRFVGEQGIKRLTDLILRNL